MEGGADGAEEDVAAAEEEQGAEAAVMEADAGGADSAEEGVAAAEEEQGAEAAVMEGSGLAGTASADTDGADSAEEGVTAPKEEPQPQMPPPLPLGVPPPGMPRRELGAHSLRHSRAA